MTTNVVTPVVPWSPVVSRPSTSFAEIVQGEARVLGFSDTQEASLSSSIDKRPTTVTIAVLGDSMVDTLGPDITPLYDELVKAYPYLKPKILNYGAGGTNIDSGIRRIAHDYEYLGKKIPSMASQMPDIVVIESFAYNPYSFEEGALDKHWLALAHTVDEVKKTIPNAAIVIATTIAPNSNVFADGAEGLSFSREEKVNKVTTIKKYLESTNRFAMGEKLPLADAYTLSLDENGNGKLLYINGGDHLHPSVEGAKLFSQVLVQTFHENSLIP